MTTSLLFAAHDLGGGRVLARVIEACRKAGYLVNVRAQGPAIEAVGADCAASAEEDWDRVLRDLKPALVVTGTSDTAVFESNVWIAARNQGALSVALLDASINLARRFTNAQPDLVGVIDEGSRQELQAPWCRARIEVVGQPHLEKVGQMIGSYSNRSGPDGRFVYFSEPVADGPGRPSQVGYDQFTVARAILSALRPLAGSLIVKPHPNEDFKLWERWLLEVEQQDGTRVEIAGGDALSLMAEVDGVVGMATMALLEAALAGIPVLALQPGRRYCPNPKVDANDRIRLIVDPQEIQRGTRAFAEDALLRRHERQPVLRPYPGSLDRIMAIIDELTQPATQPFPTKVT